MSTFVGHSVAAAVIASSTGEPLGAQQRQRVMALAITAALLPDLDVLVLALLGPAAAAHRGLSHSLLFAVASAGVLTLAARPLVHARASRLFAVLLLAALSHLLLDFLMGAGPPIRPFAPFDGRGYLAPVRLLPIAYYARSAEGYRSAAFWLGNGVAAALEVAILAPPMLALKSSSRTRALAATVTVAAVAVTLAVYN